MATTPRRAVAPVALLAAALALVGCATVQKSTVILLPEEGNANAEVTVSNPHGTQVLSRPYQATEIASPDAAPAAPVTMDRAKVQALFGEVLTAMPAPPVRFLLYFESDSTELTAESRQFLPKILEAIAQRSPAEISVVGHTDRTGTPERNVALGRERAEAVAALLRSLGVVPATMETGSHGETDPLVPTAPHVSEPRNRRVEVTVR